MIEFTFLTLFRILSGGQNGLGYDKDKNRWMATAVLVLSLIGAFFLLTYCYSAKDWLYVFAILYLLVSLAGVLGVENSFSKQIEWVPIDIHFWELFATGGVTLAFAAMDANLIMIAASIYPALIIHKGLINIGSGKGFWYEGTDDPTGKTFSIPLLEWKIRRLDNEFRITMAVSSIILAILVYVYDWSIVLSFFIK